MKNSQSDRLDALLKDTPGILARTAAVKGNREVDLHPCIGAATEDKELRGLNGKVCVIGGASRGIGQGMAVRFAIGGAKAVCVLGRSDGKVITGPGTLSNVVGQIDTVAGKGTGLAVQCDLSKPEQVGEGIGKIIAKFGRIDVCVNNASALYPVGVEAVDERRFNLMNHVCVRGAFLLTREALPHMKSSRDPHVLSVAPAPIADRTWMGPHTCYSGTKTGMGMLASAWSAEFPDVRFNTLWPHRMVATFAVTNTVGADLDGAVTVAHMADPAYRLVTSDSRTRFYLDTGALKDMQIADTSQWQVEPTSTNLFDDFMVEPLGLQAGQVIEYVSLPAGDMSAFKSQNLLLVGTNNVTATMESTAKDAGASVRDVELVANTKAMDAVMEGAELDAMFIAAGPSSSAGTLETNAEAWEWLFDLHCKAPYFYVAKGLPLLRRIAQPRVVMAAPLPACSPESFASPSVPCALIAQIRGLYVIGMAEEFTDSPIEFNAIWETYENDPPASRCLDALSFGQGSMQFYAVDVAAMPSEQKTVGPLDYTLGVHFNDTATSRWL
jgi:citronellol/citronellal dehydrogenase